MIQRRIIAMIILSLFTTSAFCGEKRNLLTDFYSRKLVGNSLGSFAAWVKYPPYSNREAWMSLPEGTRKSTIIRAEEFLGYTWPPTTATMYLEFSRTGNRAVVDGAINKRLGVLRSLVLAELMEGKGRFLDDIINGVFSFCEQTYWGMSATFYMYKTGSQGLDNPNTKVPDKNDPIVDLSAADAAADLAWTWHFLHDEFDKISPIISKRLKKEIREKILEPFYERYDFWWITGWDVGSVNNWTPWCNHNLLTCIALLEDNPVKKEDGIYKTMASVDLFINSYPDDGGCDEGPNYWGVAGGKLFDYLDLLNQVTNGKVNIFSNEIVKNIGRYIYRVYISDTEKGQYYVNYSDAPAIIRHDGGRIFRYGKAIEDPLMQSFGTFLLQKSGFESEPISGRIGEALENLFNLEGWQLLQGTEPLIPEFYFQNREIVFARDNASAKGFYFAAKGGNNGESHNHNDVGSCILFFNGNPVLIDVGVGTYTAKTFSNKRYEIWTMQSEYHNLPVINGFGQTVGNYFKACDSKYVATKDKITFSTDISGAYPAEADIQKWVRKYTLERGISFRINDLFQMKENRGKTSLHFMTSLESAILKPGVLQLKGDDFVLFMKYNPSVLKAKIESKNTDDRNLERVWGSEVTRIVMEVNNRRLSENISVNVTKIM